MPSETVSILRLTKNCLGLFKILQYSCLNQNLGTQSVDLTLSTYSKTRYSFPFRRNASRSSTIFSCLRVRNILSSRRVVLLTSSFSGNKTRFIILMNPLSKYEVIPRKLRSLHFFFTFRKKNTFSIHFHSNFNVIHFNDCYFFNLYICAFVLTFSNLKSKPPLPYYW